MSSSGHRPIGGRLVGGSRFVGVGRDSGIGIAGSGSGHSLSKVEGAAGQGATLASASGPPLHLLQLTAAALEEALAGKLKGRIRILCLHFWITQILLMNK